MANEFLTFQTFSDIELANAMAEKLAQNNIEYRVEKVPPLLDSTIIGNSSLPDIAIKLHPGEFTKAHKALEEYYKNQMEGVESDYYLFAFTNNELFEIISKPDEWGPFDYQLARKILNDRGQNINEEVIEKLKAGRLNVLAKPEKAGVAMILLGYLFIVAGAFDCRSMLAGRSNFFIFKLFIGLVLGSLLAYSKKTLPDGQRVFAYRAEDQKQGRLILLFGSIMMIFAILVWIFVATPVF